MRQTDKTKDSCKLVHEQLERPVLVKKNTRARRMTLRVSHTRRDIVLSIPTHANWKQAGVFVEKHIDWLKGQLESLSQPIPFVHKAVVPLEGVPHEIRFSGPRTSAQKGIASISIVPADSDGGLPCLQVLGEREHAPRRLTDWLKKRARARLLERVVFHGERLQLKHKKLSVRDQSSRWGSCSSTGALSFSWRLIFAPADILDYVAAHEVAHLGEMNHSARFWKLVAQTKPEFDEARHWLRRHGQELHCYGAQD